MTCKWLRSASSRNVPWSSSGLLPYRRTWDEPPSTPGEAFFILPFHGDSILKAHVEYMYQTSEIFGTIFSVEEATRKYMDRLSHDVTWCTEDEHDWKLPSNLAWILLIGKEAPPRLGCHPLLQTWGSSGKSEPTAKATHWMRRCRCGTLKEYTKLNCLCNILCKCTENTHPVESEEQLRGHEIHIKDPIKPHMQWQSNLASFISSFIHVSFNCVIHFLQPWRPSPDKQHMRVCMHIHILFKNTRSCVTSRITVLHTIVYVSYIQYQLYNSMPQYYLWSTLSLVKAPHWRPLHA